MTEPKTKAQRLAYLTRSLDAAQRQVDRARGALDAAVVVRDAVAEELRELRDAQPCIHRLAGHTRRFCEEPGQATVVLIQGQRVELVLCESHARRYRPAPKLELVP